MKLPRLRNATYGLLRHYWVFPDGTWIAAERYDMARWRRAGQVWQRKRRARR